MIQLVIADQLRRREQAPAAFAKAAIGGERGMFGKPTRDCGGRDLTIPLISNEPVNIGEKRLLAQELAEFP
jgi:hypothetical protein